MSSSSLIKYPFTNKRNLKFDMLTEIRNQFMMKTETMGQNKKNTRRIVI